MTAQRGHYERDTSEMPWCNLPICPEDGDHRITTGRCLLVPPPPVPAPDLIAKGADRTLTLDSPGDLRPGDVVVSCEWDDATEYVITVRRALDGD